MDFCVLIPARLASTRLPDKPLADIAGKPMVVRVAERPAPHPLPASWSRPTMYRLFKHAATMASRRYDALRSRLGQ
jgi:hypothetical protein